MSRLNKEERRKTIEEIGNICETFCSICDREKRYASNRTSIEYFCQHKCWAGKKLQKLGSKLIGEEIKPSEPRLIKKDLTITKSEFIMYRNQGYSDEDIVKKFNTSWYRLNKFKKAHNIGHIKPNRLKRNLVKQVNS